MDLNKLQKILEDHVKWLKDPRTGERANLHDADLSYANLRCANLRGADLWYADLHDANLTGADLSDAYLSGADLRDAHLRGANLRGANLTNADLRYADLSGANLHDADLTGADLRGAYLSGADLTDVKTDEHTKGFHLACPAEGEFVGWKKAAGRIVTLKVPVDAKRSSATARKCRCSKAEVLAIEELDGAPSSRTKATSNWDPNFIYEVGKTVEVNDFDEDRWHECSAGIHFFMTREEAVDWV